MKEAVKQGPSGNSNRPHHVTLVLQASEAIDKVSSFKTHGKDSSSDNSGIEFVSFNQPVRPKEASISTSVPTVKQEVFDKGFPVKKEVFNVGLPVKKEKANGLKIMKAYKVNHDPKTLPPSMEAKTQPCRNGQLAVATETFGQLANYFSPTTTQERDSSRTLQQFHLQLKSLLETQLLQARQLYENLWDKHCEEMAKLQDSLIDLQDCTLKTETEVAYHTCFGDPGPSCHYPC